MWDPKILSSWDQWIWIGTIDTKSDTGAKIEAMGKIVQRNSHLMLTCGVHRR